MELECDLSAIQNEDLLRQMWQQTEDNDHKKEIRSHLYKLRESRLRDLYQGEIMSGNYAKDPLNPSHGDSLVGQNFQSLKSKEVRDSVSPTSDLKFHSMTLQHPNTTGWDVQTSSEVSPDGRAYRTETLATTDGVEKINGGTAEFRGRNEQRASASHQGDDKNFVKKASESSNTHLQEHVVIGDENSGRTEMKSSSTTTSSNVTSSTSNVEYSGGEPLDGRYIMDNTNRHHNDEQQQRLTQEQYIQQQQQQHQQRQQQLQQQEFEQIKKYQQQQQQKHQQEERQYTEEFNRNRQESSTSRNVDTQQTTEKSRRIVDMDKASPEYQKHVQDLMSQPGEIISNTVEYPKPNVKMITTVKRLPDGTIVKNKRYETEELKPTLENQRQRTTSTTSQSSTQHRNEQQRRQQTEENVHNRQQNLHNTTTTTRRHEQDVIDNAEPVTRVQQPQQQLIKPHATEHYSDEVSNVETKFSSVKKSSRRFSTETTSETIEEFADQVPTTHAPGVRGKPSQDFSTHGFPSVKPNKPTQEYPSERPHGAPQTPQMQTPDFSTQGFPSVRPNKPTQEYPSQRPHPSDDVEYINQRTVIQSNTQNTHGHPNATNITTTKDGDAVIVSSESTRSSKYKTNAERTFETEVIIEGDHSERPQKLTTSRPVDNRGFPVVNEATPGGRNAPRYEQPSTPHRPQPDEDFSTHGFPSVRDVAKPSAAQPTPTSTPTRTINQDGSVTIVSSETKKTIKHNANREHIIETEIVGDHDYRKPAGVRQPDTITFPPTPQPNDFSTHGFPSVRDSAPTNDAYRRQGTPTREQPNSPRKPTDDYSTHGFPSVRTPNTTKTVPDYSTPSGGYPNTKNTTAPKLMPTQPSRIQPSTTTPRKSTTTTTDSSQRLISKERDVDASHRAFAASLRCSSPVDSIDHHHHQQRMTPRSSVSSTRTFRREGREGSHDSDASRISSGTVTRSSPSKSVGKTVVTKQTTVTNKARNGSNETIDLTTQRHTKSPSPSKNLTTTTTRTTTTTSARKSPGGSGGAVRDVPKTDKQILSKTAENAIVYPISTINEPTLTIKKTHFNENDASFLAKEVAAVEEPIIIKKHFYKLGPSDKAIKNHVDEKSSPHSPTAPSNHILHRTHPKSKSPIRDDFEDVNYEEPIPYNQAPQPPLSSSINEPKQRNISPTRPKSNNNYTTGPQTICQPNRKDEEPSIEKRRTVVRESEFENNDWQNTILDNKRNEKPYPIKGISAKPNDEKPKNGKVPQDEYIETIDIEEEEEEGQEKEIPLDTSDYPIRRPVPNKRPDSKNKSEVTRTEKLQAKGEEEDVTEKYVTKKPQGKEPISKKPLDVIGKRPKDNKPHESLNRKPNEKQSTEPACKTPGDRKPSGKSPSPTRRTSDVNTSKISTTTTSTKTTRTNDNTNATIEDKQPKQPNAIKPSETGKIKPDNENHSPTRKQTDRSTLVSVTKKTPRKEKPDDEPLEGEPDYESPFEPDERKPTNKRPSMSDTSPTRKTKEEKVVHSQPINKGPLKEKKPKDKRPSETEFISEEEHSPTRKTVDTNKSKVTSVTTTITKTRNDNVSPTRYNKPVVDRTTTSSSMHNKPTKDKPSGPDVGKQAVKPIRHTSPKRANEPQNSDEEDVPARGKPAGKPRTKEPVYTESSSTKSANLRNIKSKVITSTNETNTEEAYEPIPSGRKPYCKYPREPEYSDNEEHERIRETTENVTVKQQTTRCKPRHPTYDDDHAEYVGPVPTKPGKESPLEPKGKAQPKKPSEPVEELSDTENQSTTFITSTVKSLRTDEPQPTRYTTTDETQRVETLFNKTDKTKITKNINEEFITFERQRKDKSPDNKRPVGETSGTAPLQPEHIKHTTKKLNEPRYNEPKPSTVERRTETYEDTENVDRREHKTSKLFNPEPKLKPIDNTTEPRKSGPLDAKPKVMPPCTTDSSDDNDEQSQETYETTTTIKTSKDMRQEVPVTSSGVKEPTKPYVGKSGPSEHSPTRKPTADKTITTTTITKNIIGRKPIHDDDDDVKKSGELFIEPFNRVPTSDEIKRVEELFKTTSETKYNKNYNEEFIDMERVQKELPDGAFFSKAPEPEPQSPTFKKKGVNPRETFEDRCRQILGMDDYGDTPGSYKENPDDESDDKTIDKEQVTANTKEFEVRIEDCEDDEPNYLNNIRDAIKPQKQAPIKTNKPDKSSEIEISDEDLVEDVECLIKERVVPFKRDSPEKEAHTETARKATLKSNKKIKDEEDMITTATTKHVKKTSPQTKKKVVEIENEESSTSESETPDKDTDEESQPETVVSEREIQYMHAREEEDEEHTSSVVSTAQKKQPQTPIKKPTNAKRSSVNSSPNTSPTRKPFEPTVGRKTSPLRQQPSSPTRVPTPKTVEPKSKTRESGTPITRKLDDNKPIHKYPQRPEQKDKPASPKKKIQKPESPITPVKDHKRPNKESPNKDSPTSSVKERLRSSTRNTKPSETESDSSPALSPTRFTERRRSSNISVHTEIIIDHSGPKSPKPTENTPEKHQPQSKKSTPTERSVSPTKPFRRPLVTERKESAPVPSVTRKDKNAKMTRSTSEQVVKVAEKSAKKTEVDSLAPRSSPTPTSIPTSTLTPKAERRPIKCFTTKTINLTTSDKRMNTQEMENVIIDIQHAKSSREPSPDKIIPTPVSAHLDTGKPRYPDVVQEPEDEPRKKPIITNIPIFEEESNQFVNCHITEIKTDKITKLVDLEEDDILDNPTIEAPKSLDYPSIDKPDDDCLLSVHEKVSKFTHTAEEIKKPKASSPFSREFDKTPKVPANDECLLSVDEKVNKFIKTAEEVTNPITPVREIERPNYTDLDEELRRDDCTLTVSQKVNKFLSTAEKLAPTTPQRSPELVAKIERTISKQSEPEYPEDISDDELMPFSENHTIEIEKRRQKDILSRPTVFENSTKTDRYTDYTKGDEVTTVKQYARTSDDDEFIPHTKEHTTKIELKRQKDILARPSIYEKNIKLRPQSPNKKEPTGPHKPQQRVLTKTTKTEQTTTKKITAEDNERIDINGERKPSTPTSKPENRRSPIKLQTSTVAVTKKRFEVADNRKVTPKSPLEPKTNKVPSTGTTGRRPTNEPQTRGPSSTSRKPSTVPDINSPYTYKRKPSGEPEHQSPQRGNRNKPSTEPDSQYVRRKPSPEPDSQYQGRKPSAGNEIDNTSEQETIESETEFSSTTRRRSSSKTKDYLEMVQTEIERFSPKQKEPQRKIPSQEKSKPQTLSHSPTRNGTTSTNKVTKVIERTNQHKSPSPDCSDIEIIETIVERQGRQIKPTTTTPTTNTIGRTRITSDTVAARRNIFENGATPKDQKSIGSSTPSPVGRRPSYMDHTVSSLEHIRRDSLEVNKHNYSRKSSIESESNYGGRPNAAVKFDVPHKPQRTASIPEDIDVESIFELEILEHLLETVTSYELRRRIRAQIRLVKKNLLNTETMVDKRQTETTKTSKSISSTHKSSAYTSNVHREETDTIHGDDIKMRKPYESKVSPKRPNQPTTRGRVTDGESVPNQPTYGRTSSPKRHDSKHRTDEEITTITTTYAKTPNGRSESPKRPTKSTHERQHSPEIKTPQGLVKEVRRTSGSTMSAHHKEYVRHEETDYAEERFNSSRHVDKTSERYEKHRSGQRSPESKSPVRDGRKSPDTKIKSPISTRTKSPDTGSKPANQRTTSPQGRSISPQGRTTSPQARTTSPQGRTPKQRDEVYTTSKVTTVKMTRSPERKSSKPTTDDNKTPIWADRKNLLKSPSSSPRKVPAMPSTTRTTATKTTTAKSTSQRQTQNRNIEEDSITSSYGIGPTDENGLPLFGIKALKKKKPSQPCEATEEVTGYVIEEKYYSDSKTKPKVERKEYIYSTNADELEEIKKTVEHSRKSSKDNVDVVRKFEKIDKDYVFEKPEAIMPDAEEFSTTSSKYVRRGSVKELSEKFIRKESSQSTTEKTGYPKAGLILRTSRGSSAEPCGDAYETTTEKYTTTQTNSGQGYRSVDGDSEDEQNVQLRQKQSRRLFTEFDNNESEERHMSTRSSTKSTRSFLNSSGETKVVTSVDDALERMRNADYVVEAGDTAEDREARSLLNKFLGASVIMKGVESVLPTTKQIKTTTITKTSYADDDGDSDLLKNKAVKTTRITKTTKSGSSSTPVTRTTCDIEEIWDEEILKELLEQATTYEERRKIRARLRDLMAEREEKNNLKSGELSQNTPEDDESSASEYEEIIEEVTCSDYSDAEAELDEDEEKINSSQKSSTSDVKKLTENKPKQKEQEQLAETTKIKTETKSKLKESVPTVQANEKESKKPSNSAGESEAKAKAKLSDDKTDSKTVNLNDKGESLVPLLQGILQKSLPKVVANSLFRAEKVSNTEVKREAEIRTHTNKGCSSSNNNNNSSSDLYTVNNSNKEKNNNNNNNNNKDKDNSSTTEHTINTNNKKTDLNTQTTNDSKDCKNLNKSLDSQAPESSTMTKNSGSNRTNVNVSKQKQLDRLSVPQKEDSGTESGEDLRLIAAGLRDSLHLQSDTNLIAEVTAALARLEQSLKEGKKDIPVDGSKREALLALVARLQTGLTSPEAALNLSNMAGNVDPFDETSSPEAEAQRSNRSRFARRRNRNSRHTVGVSREELEDARRYMEDMMLMENISNCTTPESGTTVNPLTAPPQWLPIEKNPSAGGLLPTNSSSTLYRPNQFVPAQLKNTTSTCVSGEQEHVTLREKDGQKSSKRPLSGNFAVSFEPTNTQASNVDVKCEDAAASAELHSNGNVSPDSAFISNRFTNKKQLMKRANTIDIPKTKKYNPDFDSDSETEEKTPQLGLKRTLQVNVKHKVRNVIPPFVPKTENDHKFLAFINKQSDKPGLGWAGTRSVSNWTNKFGNLKHTFEVGAAAQATTGKPPQAPGHVPHNAAKNYWQKQVATQDYQQQQQQQQYLQYQQQQQQQQLQRSQQEAQERQRRFERERFERDRIELDRLERQRLERERQERDRIEQEYYEREIMERERLATAQHAAMPSMSVVPKPAPVNKFQHAPQSVFRPIDNNDSHRHNVYKPIPQLPQKVNTWQPPSHSITNKPLSAPVQMAPASPQFLSTKSSFDSTQHVISPSSNTSSPIGLPWVAKPAVDNSDFRKIAHTFEERSQNDNRSANSYLQRHHSLRSPKISQHQLDEYKKRPSLPSTTDPYMAANSQYVPQQQQSQVYASANDVYGQPAHPPPPPTNISFTYADLPRTSNCKSYPCLPSAVETSISAEYARQRESSLTNPNAIPLVLTNSNPTYDPHVDRRTYYNSAPQMVKQFDYVSPMDSASVSPNVFALAQTDYTDDDLDSDNLMEYRAETRVMGKPKSQTAVTVRDRRTAHASDDEVFGKNSRNAQSLLHTMKNIGRNGNGGTRLKKEPVRKVDSPKACLSPDGRAYQAPIVEPLFPQLTKFEPNRTPEYIEDPIINQVTSKPQKTSPKTPPIPNQQMDRSLQLARAEEQYRQEQQKYVEKAKANYANVSKTSKLQQQQQQQQQQLGQYQTSSVSSASSINSSVPYVSETQAAYVVSYPTEDVHEAGYCRQPPTTLPLQRNRNISENSSASSSISHNLPSPATSWTANPIHTVDEILPQRNQSLKSDDTRNSAPTTYQTQTQTYASTQKQSYKNVHEVPQSKTKASSKQAPISSQYIPSPTTYQPPYTEPQTEKPLPQPRYVEPQVEKPLPQPHYAEPQAEKPLPQPQPRTKVPAQERKQPKPAAPTTQPLPQTKTAPKLITRSQKLTSTSQSQSFDQHYQTQQKTLSRQRTVDVATITPLQAQNRVLSHQSLVSSKQRQYEQREQEADQLNENRRKSLGNVFDAERQQRKAATYITESKTVVKQEYKSSAPSDTPDIVKSSLPKDDTPILKKFGPPQRHHYVPNSYQSPAAANTQKQKYESTSTTKIIKNTQQQQHEIVQHSTLTKKPSIVEIPATPQPDEDLIPRNIVLNNISAFTSLSRRSEKENGHHSSHGHEAPTRVNRLSKSDSWNQIVQIQNQVNAQLPPTSPKFGGIGGSSSGSELRRTKSGHTLNVRMYEAGIDKSQIGDKQRTVAAYFSGKKSPNQMGGETVEMRTTTMATATSAASTTAGAKKTTINRHKSSEKMSASRKSLTTTTKTSNGATTIPAASGGLIRSATMPHIASLNLLDESNVEDAFEQLMMDQQATSTTEKTETKEKDGAVVTTTTKVTTRTVTGTDSSATKPVSPFAKFRQLDKQSSQQSPKSPSTPTTPGGKASPSGSARIFQFTDPALNARAATAKEQLLQWCQSKTQEYENIKITNFSASWSDGLAFCALIHHFLPDAFDYSKLTPKSRRHNFELAFTVADEKAGIAPLLDVEDMVEMQRPDWKCVFIYVQSIYRRFRNCQ